MLNLATAGGSGATTRFAVALMTLLLVALHPTVAAAHPDEAPISTEIKGPAAAASSVAAVVKMNDDMPMYSPQRVTIKAGQMIEWRNMGAVIHSANSNPKLADNPEDALFPPGSELFNSGPILPGGAFRHTFKVPGRYRYYCLSHERDKMIGEIMVEAVPSTKPPHSHRENREDPSNHWLNTDPPEASQDKK